jgi:carboxypeptidase Taq
MDNSKGLRSDHVKLMDKYRELVILDTVGSLVNWDMETKMPPKGVTLRSDQLALLARIGHKMAIDPEIGNLLGNIQGYREYDSLNELEKRNLYLIKRRYDEETKLPEELVTETAKQQTITINVWKKAKAAQNFSMFRPELEKLLELRRKAAEILMEVKGTATPYDALIDSFEPKMTAEKISHTFSVLKEGLVPLIKKCVTAKRQPDTSILHRKVPIDVQRRISSSLASFIGYDIESSKAGGRIDETEHPFTTGYYDDVRITTHYYENAFASSLFSVLHEGGHALYEQDLNQRWIYQPVGSACSMAIHESQSRFVENIVGRSPEFWAYYLPKLKELTGDILSDVTLDSFVQAINEVKPSKIRVNADEVTYGLHIIIRFEIERDLIPGKISVEELPEMWNKKYKDYLGVEIENDSEGVMQDTHWAGGSFGYFPTYALGNICDGQFLVAMKHDVPDWREELKKGNFHIIKSWLADHIHRYGALYDPEDLVKKVTGEEINPSYYLDYLNSKYSRLYEF